jgi:hypothetical protein
MGRKGTGSVALLQVQRVPLMTGQKVDLVSMLVHLLESLTCGARRLSLFCAIHNLIFS